jgi:hypothetical protein
MAMEFFERFSLTKKKNMYSIKYQDKTLCLVSIEAISKIVIDFASKDLKDALLQQATKKLSNTPLESKAMQLEKVFTRERRKYHKNRKIKAYTPKMKEFAHFVKAVEIMRRHKVDAKTFIQAQIKGLQFINNFQGQFPRITHLSTMGAEERLLDYLQEQNGTGNATDVDRIKLSTFDKNTELMDNPEFVNRWNKLDKGTASLRDAYFLADCMLVRKGHITKKVKDYIEKLEAKDE